MKTTDAKDFDFDTFAKLAKDDPEEFNRRRRELIDANISAAPDHIQKKLRHLQFRADAARDSSPNAVAATQKLSTLMWDSVAGPSGLLESLNAFLDGDPGKMTPRPRFEEKAKVIEFPVARQSD